MKENKGRGGTYKVVLLFVQPLFVHVIRSKQFCPKKKEKKENTVLFTCLNNRGPLCLEISAH